MHKEVVIVGAGAAGVGMAATLIDYGVEDLLLIDRHEIGASFTRWPAEMRLITPSFNSTLFGILDLNAIALQTSVANFLEEEHPTGKQYARYLEAVVNAKQIEVELGKEIAGVNVDADGQYVLTLAQEEITCRFLIWAAGEFQFPNLHPFTGAEHCVHNSQITSYNELHGDEFIVIGAFESGIDALYHLAQNGKKVTCLCADEALSLAEEDPSRSLSPYTRQRFQTLQTAEKNIEVHYECRVTDVKVDSNKYVVRTQSGKTFTSSTAPILGIGFRDGTGLVEPLFERHPEGYIALSDQDESTISQKLFLAGPMIRHEHHIFCYIYKFRQRFALIAEAILAYQGREIPTAIRQTYTQNQMRLSDLSVCDPPCIC
jgi:putative flavoprotein involved in K+ transport